MKKQGKTLLACSILALNLSANLAKADTNTEDGPVSECKGDFGKKLGSRAFSLPRVGVESTAEVGQTMVSTYKTDLMDATKKYVFSLQEPAELTGRSLGQDFKITLFPTKLVMAEGLLFRPAYAFQYANDSSPRTGASKPDVLLTMSLPSREVTAKVKIGFGEQRLMAGTAEFVTTPQCTLTGPESFQKELIYSGVAKGVVTILYREFAGGLARPAFSQELHFDLSDGDEIGYKGTRFKIIKASNLGISYVVTRNLD